MDEPSNKRQKGKVVYIPRVPPPDPKLWRWLFAVNHTHYWMFNAQQGGHLGLDIMAYMEKHGLNSYGPTPHLWMVDLGLGQDQMLRGIQHEAEAIRKQAEALVAASCWIPRSISFCPSPKSTIHGCGVGPYGFRPCFSM
jgi:hypothetical protein